MQSPASRDGLAWRDTAAHPEVRHKGYSPPCAFADYLPSGYHINMSSTLQVMTPPIAGTSVLYGMTLFILAGADLTPTLPMLLMQERHSVDYSLGAGASEPDIPEHGSRPVDGRTFAMSSQPAFVRVSSGYFTRVSRFRSKKPVLEVWPSERLFEPPRKRAHRVRGLQGVFPTRRSGLRPSSFSINARSLAGTPCVAQCRLKAFLRRASISAAWFATEPSTARDTAPPSKSKAGGMTKPLSGHNAISSDVLSRGWAQDTSSPSQSHPARRGTGRIPRRRAGLAHHRPPRRVFPAGGGCPPLLRSRERYS